MKLHKYAKLVVDSLLFDSAFYASYCSEHGVDLGGQSPVIHFLTRFWESGVNPHPLFDCKFYLEQHPPLEEEIVNPVLHYLENWRTGGRDPHPAFDSDYYRRYAKGLDDSGMTPLGHFLATEPSGTANPNPYFDNSFYRIQLQRVSSDTAMNPLVHFLLQGAALGLNPSPRFNTRYYLTQNPDVATSTYNPLVHFLLFGKDEGRPHYSFFSADNFQVDAAAANHAALEQLLADYKQLRQHEPLLPASNRLDGLSEHPAPTESRAGSAYFDLSRKIEIPFSHLFLMPFLLHGGAEKVSMNMVACVAENLGVEAPVVLVTDSTDTSALEWLPTGVRIFVLDDLHPELTSEDKEIIVTRLILQSRPSSVTNINSVIGWNVYKKFGRQLSLVTHLVAGLFGYGFDTDKAPDGLAVYFLNHSMDHLRYLLSDTERFRGLLADQFGFSAADRTKQVVVYSPMASNAEKTMNFSEPRSIPANNEILWASRLCPGKRPDVLLEVARALSHLKFHAWGKPDQMPRSLMSELEAQANIILHGQYDSFFSIPFGKCGLLLYTTEGDGMPLVLLEAVASGFPIVAPRIGGISELIKNDTGWLIEKCDDSASYVKAVKEIQSSPERAAAKVRSAQALVRERHLWSSFSSRMLSLEDFWGGPDG